MTRRLWFVALWCGLAAAPVAAQDISFSKQVAPILAKQCIACHGPKDAKGKYQLHTFEALAKAGEGGTPGVVAGKPMDSELFTRLIDADADVRMPKDADPLPADQIALIKRWIEQGAKYDAPDPKAPLNSIIPKLPHAAAPEKYRVPVQITALAFNADGTELAAGGYREISIWSVADGKLLRRIGNVAQRTYALQYSPDGKLLAAASGIPGQLGEVRLYDPADGKLLADLATLTDCAFGVAFNPAGTKLAACGADRSIRIFDVASKKEEKVIEDHADWVSAVAWSNDGTKLVSASRDKTSKVFDAVKGEALATYNGHGQAVFGAAFSADDKQVLTSGGDNQVHLWNPADGKKTANIGGYGGEVYQLIVKGDLLFSCSADKTARHHTVGNKAQVRSHAGHTDWVLSLAYHDATKRLASGAFDGEVRIWNTADGMQVLAFKAAPGYEPPPATAGK